MKGLIAFLVGAGMIAGPAHADRFRLTPQQAREVRENFTFVRACPVEVEPYADNEKGGDCIGGESGSPQQSSGG